MEGSGPQLRRNAEKKRAQPNGQNPLGQQSVLSAWDLRQRVRRGGMCFAQFGTCDLARCKPGIAGKALCAAFHVFCTFSTFSTCSQEQTRTGRGTEAAPSALDSRQVRRNARRLATSPGAAPARGTPGAPGARCGSAATSAFAQLCPRSRLSPSADSRNSESGGLNS